MLFLYGAATSEPLDLCREKMYKDQVTKQEPGQQFQMKTLPPTSSENRQHSFRTYIQVQEWQGRHLNPNQWGWTWEGSVYRPNPSDKPPAPASILDLVLCNCTCGV